MMRAARAVAVSLVALSLGGCLPSFALKTGSPVVEEQVRGIVPGTTTKGELFDRFGSPTAIVGRDEVAVVVTPATYAAPYRRESTYAFDAGTFYELFGAAGATDEYRRIYFYRHVVSGKMTYFMLLAMYEHGDTKSDRVWVLIDEKTGVVEDYAYKKSGAPVAFGVPRRTGTR